MNDIETGEGQLTVRTVRLKLLTGPFRLGHLLYVPGDGDEVSFQKVVILL